MEVVVVANNELFSKLLELTVLMIRLFLLFEY